MSSAMKAAVYMGNRQLVVEEVPLPEIGHHDILLQVAACGVCGTDIVKVVHNLIEPPAILGHEVAGYVAQVGARVNKFKVGDRVVVAHHTPCYACHYCQHGNVSMCETFKTSNLVPGGFAQYLKISSAHVMMTAHRLPDNMRFDQAIHMEPLACMLRNVKRAALLPGDTALVVGLGSVGLLTGQILKHHNVQVVGTDLIAQRRALAQQLNFYAALDPHHNDIREVIDQATQGRGVDVVVLTSGDSQVYSEAMNYARDGGKVSIFAGLSPEATLSLNINQFYKKEITYYASYSPSSIELLEALQLLQQGAINVDILSSAKYDLDQTQQAFSDVMEQKVYKAIVCPMP